jgi:hypothetical protein
VECGDWSPLYKALTSQRTPNLLPKIQNPVTFCRAKTTGGNGIAGKFPGRPEHLSRAFKSCETFRQVSWLYHRFRPAMTVTVARPRGIHTRFPILLAFMRGTSTRYQKSLERGGQ